MTTILNELFSYGKFPPTLAYTLIFIESLLTKLRKKAKKINK